jgi:hypothetical protein
VCAFFITRSRVTLLQLLHLYSPELLNVDVYAFTGTTLLQNTSSTSQLTASFPNSRGCIFSYSGSSPIYTSGSTVFPPITSGGPSRTLPFNSSLQFAFSCERTHYSSIAAFTSSKNASASSLQSPIPTAPATLKYKDPNLTGCYAGTGGSTTFTLTSGDQILLNPEKGLSTNIGAEPQTYTYACSEFFTMGLIPWHLKLSFARSPACASYARDMEEFQSAQLSATSWKLDPNPYPPGVVNGDAHIPFNCCGGCKLFAPEVQVYHWPTTSSADCSQTNATITSHARFSTQQSQIPTPVDLGRSHALSFAVVDGSTLIFPSLYLAIHGAVSVHDSCGVKGNTYYNPTIAVPSGSLSTLSFSSTFVEFAGYSPQTGVYDPAACRTYGLSNGSTTSFLDGHSGIQSWITSVSYSFGPPYNPIVLPPKQLTALDPEWEACTSWDNYGENAYDLEFGLYDPPRVLTPAAALAGPSTTSSGPVVQKTSQVPQPAGPVFSADPKITASPQTAANPSPPKDRSSDEETSTAGLAGFILQPFRPASTENVNEHDPADPTGSSASLSLNQLMIPQDPGKNPQDSDPPFITIGNTPYYLAPPITITSSSINIILTNPLGSSPPILTIDGKTYTANQASQYIIGSQTLSPGGSTININGMAYSLAPFATQPPNIASIVSALSSNSEPILTVNGKEYAVDLASHYIISSQKLVPHSPTATVNSIPYAMPSSPTAIISGDRIIALDPENTADPGVLSILSATGFRSTNPIHIYNIDGIPLTGDPNALAVASTTLKPGSPALTVSGHTLSLAIGGALVVDGATSTLAPATSDALTNDGTAGFATGASGFRSTNPSQTYSIDDTYLTGGPNALAVSGTTLLPGSPPLIVSGHTLSLATAGTLVVDGSPTVLASNTLSASLLNDIAPTADASALGNGSNRDAFTGGVDRGQPTRAGLRMLVLIVLTFHFVV